ncbi:hypothetical protein EfmAA94_31660 (plasmid) [Enterococcus faecium]|nr:hypothetical protein EfmAA94_31660 [Enterococcus faecium]
MKLFVGIDVSSEKLDVCFLTDDNQLSILSEISVANDIEGASFIRETILEFNDSYHFDQIVIGMESTSMYSKGGPSSMKLFVGIDVSSEKLDVCFLTDDNQLSILSEISVANDIEGASFIRETILEFNDSYHFDQIVIGMESTSMYSFHPSMFFHEDEKLKT